MKGRGCVRGKEKKVYKITDSRHIHMLFGVCWLAYFSTYIGRLNYSASLSQMIAAEGFDKGQAGFIGTIFFFSYGVGQIASGFLGDKWSPRFMVFSGLLVSGICNFCMAVFHNPVWMAAAWGMNGMFQAMIWSPMVRLLSDWLLPEIGTKSCVAINSSVPLGTMAAYGLSAGMIAFFHWRGTFLLAALWLILIALVWLFCIGRLESYDSSIGVKKTEKAVFSKSKNVGWKKMLGRSGILWLFPVLVVQGALKDGVTAWVPAYMNEIYEMGIVMSVLTTMMIPLFNLLGVYLAAFLNDHYLHNEIRSAGAFFFICGAAILILHFVSGHSLAFSFIMLSVSTTAMMAVNTMLIAAVPSYFGVMGKASSVSGMLNSFVYAGSAVSTYGIGALSAYAGWDVTISVWFFMAAISVIICTTVWRRWEQYRKECLK